MQCHLHLGSAIWKLCTKQQKQRNIYVIFSNNYVSYLPLRKKNINMFQLPLLNGLPIELVIKVSCSFSLEVDVQLLKALKWWLWEFKICHHPNRSGCADSTSTLVPLHKCVPTLIWSYCHQGGSKSMECSRVSAVIDGRVQLILPLRTACVTFAHQSTMEIYCGLHHSSAWGVQHHYWRTKCYSKVCSLFSVSFSPFSVAKVCWH